MSSSDKVNKVEVLFDGFSRMESEGSSVMHANCTCSLVVGDGVKMIVDTLTPWDGPRLLEALATRSIQPDDVSKWISLCLWYITMIVITIITFQITHVVATHGHSDHIGNLNLFLKAKHIVGTSMNHGESYYDVLQNGNSLKISEGKSAQTLNRWVQMLFRLTGRVSEIVTFFSWTFNILRNRSSSIFIEAVMFLSTIFFPFYFFRYWNRSNSRPHCFLC